MANILILLLSLLFMRIALSNSDVDIKNKTSQTFNVKKVDTIINGQNFTINYGQNKTADETDDEIVAAVFNGKLDSECFFEYPKKWSKFYDETATNITLIPKPGDFFNKFGFQFNIEMPSSAPILDLFVAGDSIDWKEAQKKYFVKDLYDFVIKLRKEYPSNIIQSYVIDKLFTPDDEINKSEKINILYKSKITLAVSYEDGREIITDNIEVIEKGNEIFAGVLIYPYIVSYPSLNDESPKGYGFSCRADNSMKVSLFSKLCAGLIQRSTLSKGWGGNCEWNEKKGRYVLSTQQ